MKSSSIREKDFVAEVKRFTNGRGVDVIYDSVGVSTFLKGLDCIRPRGMMVLFGQSSGAVAPFDPRHSERERLAVSDAAQSGSLRRNARGTGVARGRRAQVDRLAAN